MEDQSEKSTLTTTPIGIPQTRIKQHFSSSHELTNTQQPTHATTISPSTNSSSSSEIIYPDREFTLMGSENGDSSFYQQLSINVDQPVGNMSISPSYRDVVLAARKGLFIIDLENPFDPPRVLNHLTKWEVADVQWNPHQARDTWVASTSNQKALIWDLDYSSPSAVKLILHSHTRAISDINWHPFNPDELATCSVDTFVHLWDLRTPKKPVISFCAWTAGATQVKFNKQNEFLLASSHDTDLKIWDIRRGSLAIKSIKAHTTKIYGIDWSRKNDTDIITCSLDKLVKVWNINEPDKCQLVIETNSPVWRARHTPVGYGILTMPQRSENTLHLWNREKPESPVHEFKGHTDVVKEFVWRTKGGGDPEIDNREFQLITWSKDQTLRLWPISDAQLKSIGHVRGKARLPSKHRSNTDYSKFTFRDPPRADPHSTSPTLTPSAAVSTLRVIAGNRIIPTAPMRPSGASVGSATNITNYMNSPASVYPGRRSLSPVLWMQGVKMVKPSGKIDEDTPKEFVQEITSVMNKYKDVKFEKIVPTNRTCTISLRTHGPWSDSGVAFLRIIITFPPQYPDNTPPKFDIQKTGMISIMNRTRISQILDEIALQHVLEKRPCLEACIRCLLGKNSHEDGLGRYERDDSDEESLMNSSRRTSYDKNYIFLGDKDDHNVLFPILCGARFSGNGRLLCFFSCLRAPDVNHTTAPTTPVRSTASASIRVLPAYTYTHPRSYESFEQYRAISRLPQQIVRFRGDGDNFSLDNQDDEDDDITPFLYFKPKGGLRESATDPSNLFQPTKLDRTGFIIYIHDLSEWLPVSQKLALEYTLYGDDPVEICKYNAKVAANNKRPELEEVWLLVSYILAEDDPSEIYNYDGLPILHRVKWGMHPCGASLVRTLFRHFSSIGDVQTLALLSCVLQEPSPYDRKFKWITTDYYKPDYNKPMMMTPDSLGGATSVGTDYFNYYSRYPEKSVQNQFLTFTPTHFDIYNLSKESLSSLNYHQHQSPDNSGISVNSPTPPTPNLWREDSLPITMPVPVNSFHQSNYYHQQQQHHRKSTFSVSHRDVGFLPSSGSTNASPPRISKRGSLAGSVMFSNKLDQIGWVDVDRKKSSELGVSIMNNFNEFDDERSSSLHVPLLGSDRKSMVTYDQYRLAYAELLYHWGLMEARAELLKFMNFVKFDFEQQKKTLEIYIHCHHCGTELKPNTQCANCQRKPSGIKCSICHRIVKGLTNCCVVCSHGGHIKHLLEWFSEGHKECPTGCGCMCLLEMGGFGVDNNANKDHSDEKVN